MKIIKNIALALVAFAFASCSGQTDTEEYSLSIRPDKTEIYADGVQEVSFTVSYGSVDVSTSKEMSLTYVKDGASRNLPAGKNTFSTSEPGVYEFSASYDNGQKAIISERVRITAVTPEKVESRYYRKMLAMEFTSIQCTYCPILAKTVKNIEAAYPGRIIPVAFHCDNMGTDPMTLPLNAKFYENVVNNNDGGLPLFAFDLRKSSDDIINEYTKIESELNSQLENYPAISGVALSTTYDESEGKINVLAKFKTDLRGEYRCHIFLIESGIEYTQAGHEGSDPYIHDNVVRAIASDNVFGAKLNQGKILEADTEYSYSKSFTCDNSWNIRKMKAVACILNADSVGSFHVNNSNECAIGDNIDYLINE